VVATTLISLLSISGQPASALPPEHATKTNESIKIANLNLGLLFNILLNVYQ
jgi:hypothetical protein